MIAFFDLEINSRSVIFDIGCIKSDDLTFHGGSVHAFMDFVSNAVFLCGHNVHDHDLKHLHSYLGKTSFGSTNTIDTLYLSPLLFPTKPYHKLLKDDKLQTEELNNPLNDSIKARDLFYDEVAAFQALDESLQTIYFNLLHRHKEFAAFFRFLESSNEVPSWELEQMIRTYFTDSVCSQADIYQLIIDSPVSLAYTLALIKSADRYSITPPWILHRFPEVNRTMFLLRGRPCVEGCSYCREALNPYKALKRYFGFPEFRSYADEPLQENAVKVAIANQSLLAIFPTGGGKSITFQVPALMAGENTKSLTVVISPLQSLMKDQVDNLARKNITDAVAINGLLDPIARSEAIERVAGGNVSILYISPESLRSPTIEKLLLGRKIARFVIDEAHCFSSWGQDFRVDYQYIGPFIKSLQQKKGLDDKIPVSCFTATAKPIVIEDIKLYFKKTLGIELQVFSSNASRTNLQYRVINQGNEDEKYSEVRRLVEARLCPTIIYVSRTKTAMRLARSLVSDGFNARAFHGKMDKEEKTENQDAFIQGKVDIMVATSAFGMGVDKDNVGMVIHYEISDSLENYVQEAGRAGRNENITAECFVLFNEEDLDKHFILLNQTKLGIKEINQVWKAIKDMTKTKDRVCNSALEIARKAGWDESVKEIETRVTTAIAALEEAGYLARGQNMSRVYATSILSKNAQEAIDKINQSEKFAADIKEKAIRIVKKLFSSKSKRLATEEAAESRIDYISDVLGIIKIEVIQIIELLRDEKILADTKDLTAFIKKGESGNRSLMVLEKYRVLEEFFHISLQEEDNTYNLKELNEKAIEAGCKDASPHRLRTIINFWAVKNWIKRRSLEYSRNHVQISLCYSKDDLKEKMEKRHFLAKIIVEHLYRKATTVDHKQEGDEILIEFSIQELKIVVEANLGLFKTTIRNEDLEDTLLYLSRIEAIKIEGGFMITYNRLIIDRVEKNNRILYKESDYERLRTHYQNKVQQIHIVGEYAKKMIDNYKDALQFVDDYFRLNYTSFLHRYFPGSRQDEIKRTLTPAKFEQLFGSLSPSQLEIIKDTTNQQIVVAAGPGSGKTRVLVHKLASLLLTEDVKHEQLLMLTFSRASATEFKKRLLDLIGKAANFIEIKTFHSYCFDLIGKVGNLDQVDSVIATATNKIRNGEIEPNRITKTVLVVDEAQDINVNEYGLIEALMAQNDEMRLMLVGDDDQNIYEFRGANSKYMHELIETHNAKKYELLENYRSKQNLVAFANQWVVQLPNRLKEVPIVAVNKSNGKLEIVEHASQRLITAVIENIIRTGFSGSTCVLTKTNKEAVYITGLLVKNGFSARLIQANDGFPLYNLQELRYFTELLNTQQSSPIIGEEEWQEAKRDMIKVFARSHQLEACQVILEDFETINPARKYKSDWKLFLAESRFEDFVQIKGETIYVSTIHKAKGKEFENVFLMLDRFDITKDESKRELYVAVTRAKTNLTIHYNGNYLHNLVATNLNYNIDSNIYSPPDFLSRVLTHQDVNLGHFEFVQHSINGLNSGDILTIVPGEGLATKQGLVVKYSKDFKETMETYRSNGFELTSAKVNFIVHWVDSKKHNDVKIILPSLNFSRRS